MLILFAGVLVAIALLEAGLAMNVLRRLRQTDAAAEAIKPWPKAAIILSLRGSDPSLKSCLRGLMQQDYPDYALHIVVDSDADPAWETIKDSLANDQQKKLRIDVLQEVLPHCSLKCSAVSQALSMLPADREVIAFIDADIIPNKNWLKDLVTPLIDSDIHVVSGLRWYALERLSAANIIRYLWNAASLVHIVWHNIPWGGTLAIKREVLEKTDYLQKIKSAFGEDTVLANVCKDAGLNIYMSPRLMQVNQESTTFFTTVKWIARQLISSRLHHPNWPWVWALGSVTLLTLLSGASLAAHYLYLGNWTLFAGVTGLYIAYVVVQLASLLISQRLIEKTILPDKDKQAVQAMRLIAIVKIVLFIPVTQITYSLILIYVQLARYTHWRGIQYAIQGNDRITLLKYSPFKQTSNTDSIF